METILYFLVSVKIGSAMALLEQVLASEDSTGSLPISNPIVQTDAHAGLV